MAHLNLLPPQTAEEAERKLLAAELKADREAGLAAVRDGMAIQFLSPKLRADREFGLAAVTQNGWAIKFLSADMQADKEVGLAAVTRNCMTIEYLSAKLKADTEVALAAVTQDGRAILLLPEEMKADKVVGLAAVTQNWMTIRYLSAELKADRDVGLTAVAQDGLAIDHVSEELRVELNALAAYWLSDVCTVAAAELLPPWCTTVIQLTSPVETQGGCAELVCVNIAGSEVARCLLGDVDDLRDLRIFISSELSVPPSRLKLLLPDGSCLHSIDTMSLRDVLVSCGQHGAPLDNMGEGTNMGQVPVKNTFVHFPEVPELSPLTRAKTVPIRIAPDWLAGEREWPSGGGENPSDFFKGGVLPPPAVIRLKSIADSQCLEVSSDNMNHHIRYTVDAAILLGNQKQAVSPVFEVRFGLIWLRFILTIYPTEPNDRVKGGGSFRIAKGRGNVQLKCEGEGAELQEVRWRVGISNATQNREDVEMRGPARFHLGKIVSKLEKDREWNFPTAVDPSSKKFVICLEIMRGPN